MPVPAAVQAAQPPLAAVVNDRVADTGDVPASVVAVTVAVYAVVGSRPVTFAAGVEVVYTDMLPATPTDNEYDTN